MTATRRVNDSFNPLDIEQMIAAEDDYKARAGLIVLNNMNLTLAVHTKMLVELQTNLENHRELFSQHAKVDAELMNKGRGMWRVLAWVLGIAQVAVVGIAVYINTNIETTRSDLTAIDKRLLVIELSQKTVEKIRATQLGADK